MNKLDSSLLTAALTEGGWDLTNKAVEADAIVINTCSVREHAAQRVLSHLGHIKHLKKSRPEVIVAIIGCMAQRLGAELLGHDVVDIVAGPGQLHEVPQMLNDALGDHQKQLSVTEKIRSTVRAGIIPGCRSTKHRTVSRPKPHYRRSLMSIFRKAAPRINRARISNF